MIPIIAGIFIGFFLSFGMIIFRVLNGSSIYSAMFFEAWEILEIALFIRPIHTLFLFASIIFLGACIFMIRYLQLKNKLNDLNKYLSLIGYAGLTYFICETIQYFLMNKLFYQDVFNTVPYFLGISILIFSTIIFLSNDKFNINFNKNEIIDWLKTNIFHTMFPLFALFLILPNMTAMMGILPDPPEIAEGEYGNMEGTYSVYEVNYHSIIPNATYDVMTEEERDREWFVRIYAPGFMEKGVKNKTIPVAIFMHGFAEYEPTQFMDMVNSITNKGNICIYIHYPSYFNIPDNERSELIREKGGENWPEMIYRYKLIIPELNRIQNIIVNNSEPEIFSEIKNIIGENEISFSYLWLGGMSLGAGMLPTLATHAIENNWGNSEFIIDGEVPSVYSTYPEYYGNLTGLPDHTLINILNADEDHVVPRCSGKWIFERLFTRDGAGKLNDSQAQYILVNSDRRGFPRLVATHYLSANAVHDQLSDQIIYKRFDAQSIFLFARANSDNNVAANALQYFTNAEKMKDVGQWSNGEIVNPPTVTNDPLGTRGTTELNCQD